jgi:hypothetical protein
VERPGLALEGLSGTAGQVGQAGHVPAVPMSQKQPTGGTTDKRKRDRRDNPLIRVVPVPLSRLTDGVNKHKCCIMDTPCHNTYRNLPNGSPSYWKPTTAASPRHTSTLPVGEPGSSRLTSIMPALSWAPRCGASGGDCQGRRTAQNQCRHHARKRLCGHRPRLSGHKPTARTMVLIVAWRFRPATANRLPPESKP